MKYIFHFSSLVHWFFRFFHASHVDTSSIGRRFSRKRKCSHSYMKWKAKIKHSMAYNQCIYTYTSILWYDLGVYLLLQHCNTWVGVLTCEKYKRRANWITIHRCEPSMRRRAKAREWALTFLRIIHTRRKRVKESKRGRKKEKSLRNVCYIVLDVETYKAPIQP